MTRRSLRLRLALAGAASVGIALIVAFFGLSLLFERHVERRVADELVSHLDQVIAGLDKTRAGRIDIVRPPADPRFQTPLSGLYWQIDAPDGHRYSRSLWDTVLTLPPVRPSAVQQLSLKGPGEAELIAVVREIVTEARLGAVPIVAAVAVERSVLVEATLAFRRDLLPYLALLALLLFAASLAQIIVGLRPLGDLRKRIALIRSGEADRLGDSFPDEVLPLTGEVDALLQSREDQLRRARERASELAHGFKTPLQVLSGDVVRLKAAGQADMARDIEAIINAMRRLVDHEMARARIADSDHRASSDLAKVVSSVITVVSRTPAGQRIHWDSELPDSLKVRMDPDDLSEVIGNIAENAARYGREQVSLRASRNENMIDLTITDDGPGIAQEKLPSVLRRGERLDTTSGGAGLGLAITESIIHTAGGMVTLKNNHPGLTVILKIPAAAGTLK